MARGCRCCITLIRQWGVYVLLGAFFLIHLALDHRKVKVTPEAPRWLHRQSTRTILTDLDYPAIRQVAPNNDTLPLVNVTDIIHPTLRHISPLTDHVYEFNCTNIRDIDVKHKLGNGVSKQVYCGVYKGEKIAVKMVTRHVVDVTACIKLRGKQGKRDNNNECFIFPNMKLMKEILLLQQLHHDNLVRMLGYCVRSEETTSTALAEHGVVAVHEYMERFYTTGVTAWEWAERLQAAIEMADLLDYLEHSPLGSLRISDFKPDHFLMANHKIKLIDMDDVNNQEGVCGPTTPCMYGLTCTGGICPGFNAKSNLNSMNNILLSKLLSDVKELPQGEQDRVGRMRMRMDKRNITAGELYQELKTLKR